MKYLITYETTYYEPVVGEIVVYTIEDTFSIKYQYKFDILTEITRQYPQEFEVLFYKKWVDDIKGYKVVDTNFCEKTSTGFFEGKLIINKKAFSNKIKKIRMPTNEEKELVEISKSSGKFGI